MTLPARRPILNSDAGALAGFVLPRVAGVSAAAETVEIRMRGNCDGSKVRYVPVGALIQSGQTAHRIGDPADSRAATDFTRRIFDRRGPAGRARGSAESCGDTLSAIPTRRREFRNAH